MFLTLLAMQAFAGAPAEALTSEELEEKRRASLPYDCLAGVCLNASLSSSPPKLVRIADHPFMRTVEICGGRVTRITAAASWNDFISERSIKGATTLFSENGGKNEPFNLHRTISEGLTTLGWVSDRYNTWSSEKVQGERLLELEDFMNYDDVIIRISSTHPNLDALCAYKATQGL